MPPASVVVAKVAQVKLAGSESFIGTVTPIRTSIVGSAVGGRVTQLFATEGQFVTMTDDKSEFEPGPLGQPLAQLRTVTLDTEIAAAESELREQEQAVAELKASLPLEIETAQANVDEIQARLTYSQDNWQRLRDLNKGGGGLSEREVQEAFSQYQSQTQLLIAQKATLNRLNATRETRLARAQAILDNRRAEVRRLAEMRENYTIRTPFEGFVIRKMTEVGQWVAAGDPVFEIIQLDPIELVINVPQDYIHPIQGSLDAARESGAPMSAQVAIEAVSGVLVGEVTQIVPQADLRSRSFPVKIRLQNPKSAAGYLLKSGMLGRASFFVGAEKEMLMVPKDALVLGQQIKVMAADEQPVPGDPKATTLVVRSVPVDVGAALGNWIQVTGMLQPDERVVIRGNERLMPGQTLTILEESDEKPPTPAAIAEAAPATRPAN